MVGTSYTDEGQIEELKRRWRESGSSIVCATDGGLKDQRGTSSYSIFFPDNEQAIVEGFAGEYQPSLTSSSTRQELLGQLGLEYWLQKFTKRWGRPRYPIKVQIVTDSQASIDIMDNVQKILGIKDTLRSEMDVALELGRMRRVNNWASRDIIKVESHIEVEQAPNPFLWFCNDRADKLATVARDELGMESLKKMDPLVFKGTRAVCIIDSYHINNNLYKELQDITMGRILEQFLINKYGWTEEIFHMIDWEAHGDEIKRFSIV